jgi:protein-S-isoprenylcysteine O-methyltransferase Ste14
MKKTLIIVGNYLFHHRNWFFPSLIALGIALTYPPQFPRGSYRLDAAMDIAGVLLCALGQALRIVTIGYRYVVRGGLKKRIWANDLVQEGMFAHARNPLYLGNILMFSGLAIVQGSPVACLTGIPVVILAYWCITLAEEQFLAGKFGATYAEYCARVNRFIPQMRGFRSSVQDMRFSWQRVIMREYSTTFGWIASALGLRALTLYSVEGSAAGGEMIVLAALLVPAVIAFSVARYLKKTRRLVDPSTVQAS